MGNNLGNGQIIQSKYVDKKKSKPRNNFDKAEELHRPSKHHLKCCVERTLGTGEKWNTKDFGKKRRGGTAVKLWERKTITYLGWETGKKQRWEKEKLYDGTQFRKWTKSPVKIDKKKVQT